MNWLKGSNKTRFSPVIIIVGPTSVGKTSLSIQLAKINNAVIVSADSRQIYKRLDIGTAKPSIRERQGIEHYFIDYLAPDRNFSAGEYGNKARELIMNLLQKKKNVIVAGGSGLYIRALIYGMHIFKEKDEVIRRDLQDRLNQEGLPVLFDELRHIDPDLANHLEPNDTQRILRGLEVFMMSGDKLSELQKEKEIPAPFPYIQIGLKMERSLLYQRINHRVEQMVEKGLINEVKGLLEDGFGNANALNAVGYKEVIQFINGEIDKVRMVELIQRNSRRYAKRQFTWFNKDMDIHWFNLPDKMILEKIETFIKMQKME